MMEWEAEGKKSDVLGAESEKKREAWRRKSKKKVAGGRRSEKLKEGEKERNKSGGNRIVAPTSFLQVLTCAFVVLKITIFIAF